LVSKHCRDVLALGLRPENWSFLHYGSPREIQFLLQGVRQGMRIFRDSAAGLTPSEPGPRPATVVRDCPERRNPRTRASAPVIEEVAPFFRTGKEMRERLNKELKHSR
jgi:hypothetical protein